VDLNFMVLDFITNSVDFKLEPVINSMAMAD